MFDDKADLEGRLWKELKSSPFLMLGVDGARDGHAQPMTAQHDEDTGNTLWFFTTKDNSLIAALGESNRAIATYTGKGHDLFATIHGALREDTDRAVVDKLWNSHVEAWFEGGKADPKLALLRLDPEKATIWKGGSFIGAAIDKLLGKDPKEDYKDNMTTVTL
ncbi:general stress protein 26 [Sphingomonas vulcanisoli]|uniref:General stress protein 26 n=1 Tax=Sphingomonas vulcanisoli TaxID=1658060 RepID=A0ABX0TZL6_9SPHN|nr:pyridoxamine 5'-phosphate oxidase family protein [Sphingomonas vulcanisoli]NIJ09190.1 general stress protein 26 [Sphingomonas vulcanisoli]